MEEHDLLKTWGLPQLGTADRLLDKCFEMLRSIDALHVSGSLFLSAEASLKPSKVLFLGLNPGGDASDATYGTVKDSLVSCRLGINAFDGDWSTSSKSYFPGDSPMQRNFKFICKRLGVSYGEVPAANLVFTRSRNLREYDGFSEDLLRLEKIHSLIVNSISPECLWIMGNTEHARSLISNMDMKWARSGYDRWSIGTGTGDFCGAKLRICHTPHLTYWDPKKNPTALEFAFEGML